MITERIVNEFYESLVEAASAEAERRIWERLQSQVGTFQERTLDTQQAAEYLGISTKTLYTMCAEKQIPHIRAGSNNSRKPVFLFRQSVLAAWMREREEESCKSVTK